MKREALVFNSIQRSGSLADRVTQTLIAAIRSGQLEAGQKLPSERELCSQLDVSRTVVREAIRSLVAKGLATPVSGSGVIITRPDLEDVAETFSMFLSGHGEISYALVHDVRLALELKNAELAARRASPDDVSILQKLCEDYEKCLSKRDFKRLIELDYAFHQQLAKASGNNLLSALIEAISDILKQVNRERIHVGSASERALNAHRRIVEAVVSADPEAARDAMEAHLNESFEFWRARSTKPKDTLEEHEK